MSRAHVAVAALVLWLGAVSPSALGQEPRLRDDRPPAMEQPPAGQGFRPGGPGGPGMMRREQKILSRFDVNNDGWLNADERAEARKVLAAESPIERRPGGGGRGMPGGGPGGAMQREPVRPGPRVSPVDVKTYPDAELFDTSVLRTIFLDFDSDAWEEELEAFHNTDVEVPCTMIVDGQRLEGVGASFRGASSYMMVPRGHKRSFSLSLDYINTDQRLQGVKSLNLLNCNGDPTFMSTVLYSHIARQHIPAPRANFVKVVVNGESWGIFVSAEQFNKEFIEQHFGTDKGARWKAPGSPNGRSGLEYLGDDPSPYKQRYEIKSKDRDADWKALIELCRTLNETPIDQLEAALAPMLNIDGVLWFLALDVALCNSDGYWTRASDYNIYRDPSGIFHIIPHDMNESFMPMIGGPGGRGRQGPGVGVPPQGAPPPQRPGNPREGFAPPDQPPPDRPAAVNPPRPDGAGAPPAFDGQQQRMNGIELSPLVGMNDPSKPLRSRLLAVPNLREKYLKYVRQIASESLAWEHLGPLVAAHRSLIEDEIAADTRKLTSLEAFRASTANAAPIDNGSGIRPSRNLRLFAELRSKFLLEFEPDRVTARSPVSGDRAAVNAGGGQQR